MTPSSQQLTIDRLTREQTKLVSILYEIIGDVQYLLQLIDPNDLSPNDCSLIKDHFDAATEVAQSLIEGE